MQKTDAHRGPLSALPASAGERQDRGPDKGETEGRSAVASDTGRIRVLHIAESALGGVGTYLNQIVPRLSLWRDPQGRLAESRVLVPEPHGRMVADLRPGSVFLYRRQGRSLRDIFRLASLALRHLREFRPEIVHLHSTFAGAIIRPLLLISRLLWGAPKLIVYSPHGWAFQISTTRLRQSLVVMVERLLALWTSRIIVLSDAEMRECVDLGFPQSKLVRIYNGLSAVPKQAVPTSWEDPRLKVFFTGRFDRQKGLDVLIRVAELARDRIVVRCAGASVVGKGASLAVPPNVELLGWLSEEEIEGQLACAEIVAIPSRWEGFGLVAIEAMRAGLPVVASRIGGLPEVVLDGVSGHLVPPDDPRALLAALLADGPESRKAKGEAGRRRFLELFTSDRSAEAIGRVYAELLGSARHRST